MIDLAQWPDWAQNLFWLFVIVILPVSDVILVMYACVRAGAVHSEDHSIEELPVEPNSKRKRQKYVDEG